MKDRSDDPSHHEGMLLPRSYISFQNECSKPVIMERYFVYIKCVRLTAASLQDDIGISDFMKYLDSF